MNRLCAFIVAILCTPVLAAPIGDYRGTGVTDIPDGDRSIGQVSAVFLREDQTCILQNGGGKLVCRKDLLDVDTQTVQNGYQDGCGDIEGGIAAGAHDLYADEQTPAQVHFVPAWGGKCSEAVRSITLVGMDETRGSWGIEGISRLADGRYVVVKQYAPPRVAVFTLRDDVDVYTPQDLFTPNCDDIGGLTVRTNGHLLLVCKAPLSILEYDPGGHLVSELPIPQFEQPEGIVEHSSGDIIVVGEPRQYERFMRGE